MNQSIWDKVDAAVVAAASATGSAPAVQAVSGKPSRWSKWRWRVANILATLVWVYVVCKLFVFDIDLYIVQAVWPQGGWIITYRFFVLIGIAAILTIGFRKWVLFGWATYFVFFPLIVLMWWLPRAIYKSRSWVAFLAVLHALTTFVLDFKYSLVTMSAALIAIALVVLSPIRQLTVVAGASLLILILIAYIRTIANVLRPSRFVAGQQSAIDKIINSQVLTTVWQLSDDLKSPQIVKFDATQMSNFSTKITAAAVVHRALYFWAYQLDTYRRGSMPYVFNLLTYMWLFIETVVAFAFINLALYRWDSTAFTFTAAPSLFDFFHYTINLMLGGSIPTLEADSVIALALSDIVRLSGPVVLVTIIATFVLSLKQSRQDDQMKDSIAKIKARGKQFDAEFQSQYEVSIAEAIERLRQVPGAFIRIVGWLSREIPQDFEEG